MGNVQVIIDGNDWTQYVKALEVVRRERRLIDEARLVLRKGFSWAGGPFENARDVAIRYGATEVFSGTVSRAELTLDGFEMVCEGNAKQLDKEVSSPKIYNGSVESILSAFLTDIGSSLIVDASPSGVTLSSFRSRGNALQVVERLIQLGGYVAWVEGGTLYCRPLPTTVQYTIVNGRRCGGASGCYEGVIREWDRDETFRAGTVYVIGERVLNSYSWNFRHLNSSGSLFYLGPVPDTITYTAGGNILTLGSDYVLRNIDGVGTIEHLRSIDSSVRSISMTWDSTPWVSAGSGDPVRVFRINSVSVSDVRRAAQVLRQELANPVWVAQARVTGWKTEFRPGQLFQVKDYAVPYLSLTGPRVRNMISREVRFVYPGGYTEVTLGSYLPGMVDLQYRLDLRLADIEWSGEVGLANSQFNWDKEIYDLVCITPSAGVYSLRRGFGVNDPGNSQVTGLPSGASVGLGVRLVVVGDTTYDSGTTDFKSPLALRDTGTSYVTDYGLPDGDFRVTSSTGSFTIRLQIWRNVNGTWTVHAPVSGDTTKFFSGTFSGLTSIGELYYPFYNAVYTYRYDATNGILDVRWGSPGYGVCGIFHLLVRRQV